ncbi:MAG: hypothetical protein JETCAE02_12590 [Anaerolineaceae bacterium]|nr:hypothetical protein [Chloroflexota bacterium]GIK09187.1 MAG: hypothetical protein BroJett001_12530 [Chloroflexota bacterium]GJQ38847.1 MAG: hypothetical protein JETCAE02_12590 [Anaerolineaceae bacterium]
MKSGRFDKFPVDSPKPSIADKPKALGVKERLADRKRTPAVGTGVRLASAVVFRTRKDARQIANRIDNLSQCARGASSGVKSFLADAQISLKPLVVYAGD